MRTKKKILVVLGGNSNERKVSLDSGKSCISALNKMGYNSIKFDPQKNSLHNIKKINPDVIFNALHGKDGEDGNIQSFFEYLKIPYTHSGVLSSMIAMDKFLSKKFFEKNNIETPKYLYLNKKNNLNTTLKNLIKKNKLTFPIVVKPNNEGSSIGVRICKNLAILQKEFKKLNKVYENLLFENYIPGQEIQVALIGGKSIGAIELKPKRAFYDYKAKYKKSANTLHIMPAQISRKKYNQVLRISEKAYKILKCKGIARCDFRYHKNTFYLLELNTQPGMTSLSLVPEIANYSNISFKQLVNWMIKDSSINR